jgi:hypothetical protein
MTGESNKAIELKVIGERKTNEPLPEICVQCRRLVIRTGKWLMPVNGLCLCIFWRVDKV